MKKSSPDRLRRTRQAAAILGLICLLCLGPKVRAQTVDLVQLFEQVAAQIRDNRLAEAEKDLNAVLKVSPELPVALNFLGTIRAKQNRLLEAERLFLRAARNDKSFTGARMNLAYLYVLKGAPAKAIEQLRAVTAIEPANAEANEKLVELLLAEGNVAEAIDLITRQKQSGSVSPSLLILLGDAFLTRNNLQQAEENYLTALEGRLDNAGALLGLAQVSRLKGETREPAIYLNRVASLINGSKSPEFLYRFAVEALRADLVDQAKTALERAVELKPKEPSYLLLLGIAALRKTDLFTSEKLFRRVLEMAPTNAQAQLHLGYVLLNQKKYGEARLWLQKSERSGVAIPEVYYYLGLVAQSENDDARAITLFEKAVQKLPSYAHARIALGSSYMKLKDYQRAQEELETAVKLDPDEPTAHFNLALLYARLKQPERAQEEMRIVEQLKSKGASATGGVVVLPPKTSP